MAVFLTRQFLQKQIGSVVCFDVLLLFAGLIQVLVLGVCSGAPENSNHRTTPQNNYQPTLKDSRTGGTFRCTCIQNRMEAIAAEVWVTARILGNLVWPIRAIWSNGRFGRFGRKTSLAPEPHKIIRHVRRRPSLELVQERPQGRYEETPGLKNAGISNSVDTRK